jgi:pyridoxal phosphate enzyme (YggS family)
MTPMTDHPVAAALSAVRARIAAAADAVGRDPRAVTLVAVSKTHGADAVRAAVAAGQRVFGENRVQEAKAKFPEIRAETPDLELHLIGPLQTNKVKDAVALFDVIQTVDRAKLARELAREMARQGRRPHCWIEVNIGSEAQKAGIAPAEVDAFLAACRADYGLPVTGLMCIPPAGEDPAPLFRLLADLARRHRLPVVSMGMSGDYEAAIAAGATHVRVGTAIFGSRPTTG